MSHTGPWGDPKPMENSTSAKEAAANATDMVGNGTGANGTMANGSQIDVGNGHIGVVEQGPTWLAELLYAPPTWLEWTVRIGILALLLVLAVLGWRVYRKLDDDELHEVGQEYLELITVVAAIVTAALVLTKYADLPYLWDVFGGTAIGHTIAQGVLRGLPRVLPGEQAT